MRCCLALVALQTLAWAVWPGTPAPNGKQVAPSRSAPASAPQPPRYSPKNEPRNTVSPGRTPAPNRMRAWAAAMRSQSARLMAKAVGRPVVPDVPWIRATSDRATHR